MAINVDNLMRVNTSTFSNALIPVKPNNVQAEDPPFDEVDQIPYIDFERLNSVNVQNYSSFFEDPYSPLKVSEHSVNMTLNAFPENARTLYENPFKIPKEALKEFNNYENPLDKTISSLIDEYAEETDGKKKGKGMYVRNAVVRSLFNPFLTLNVVGIVDNVPLTNSSKNNDYNNGDVTAKTDLLDPSGEWNPDENGNVTVNRWKNKDEFDTSDCSIKKLVELSNTKAPNAKYSKLGRATYKYADFMYCKDLGKVSNNYLITLRRFPHPVGDNIFTVMGNEYNDIKEEKEIDYEELNVAPDVGRLVAWLGDENKLEDILKFTVKDSWKPFESGFYDQQNSQEDEAARGPLGAIVNLANPKYRAAVRNGIAGSGNTWLSKLSGAFTFGTMGVLSNQGTYESNPVLRGEMYDRNKIYEPKGTIRDTHQYEGKMTFVNNFTLTFNYELRAYENINPKSAFLDLIGNILKVTYRNGIWWGGENKIYGAPGNKEGWKKANKLIDDAGSGVENFVNNFFNGNFDASSFLGIIGDRFKGFIDTSINGIINTINDLGSEGNNEKKVTLEKGVKGAMKVFGGMFRNAIGRPAVYALSSILSGEPVGLWHVTIGNPRNPIAVMGNMIIDDTSIQQYGPLGIDDFPTGIKVVVSLKHAKSRDASEIANMYTKGMGMIHIKPKIFAGKGTNVEDITKYYGSDKETLFKMFGTSNTKMIQKALSN